MTTDDTANQIPRRAREWYPISKPVIEVPDPPSVPSKPNRLLGITSLVTFVGVALMGGVMFAVSGTQSIGSIAPLLLFGVLTGVTTLITSLVQGKNYRDQLRDITRAYEKKLNAINVDIETYTTNAQNELYRRFPPFTKLTVDKLPDVPHIMERAPTSDIDFWNRSPDDGDFLGVRLGIGEIPAPFEVKGSVKDAIVVKDPLEELNVKRHSILTKNRLIQGPVAVNLAAYSCVTILADETRMSRARELLRGIVGQVAYRCGPDTLHIWAMSPSDIPFADDRWEWMKALPHAEIDEDQSRIRDNTGKPPLQNGVAIGNDAATQMLAMIAREIDSRRAELRRQDNKNQNNDTIARPHLLMIVDHFTQGVESSIANEPEAAESELLAMSTSAEIRSDTRVRVPIQQPELAAALTDGTKLGITTVCICVDRNRVPEGCELLIDLRDIDVQRGIYSQAPRGYDADMSALETGERRAYSVRSEAVIRQLLPEADPPLNCTKLDNYPAPDLVAMTDKLRELQPVSKARTELPSRVKFSDLFPEYFSGRNNYDPEMMWDRSTQDKTQFRPPDPSQPQLRPIAPIPLGFRLGRQMQYLNLNNEFDRAHGMIAGQTGTGKSVLLQTIITAFAATHPPNYLNFLLVDFKSGLALERFRNLPHTIGYLSNVDSTAQIQRFVTMVRAEKDRRGAELQKRKQAGAGLDPLPRLLIVVDEFVEMANSEANAQLIDDFVSVLRLGRELGMHLLVTGQRPEGKMASRVMDLVQYRICLRMSEEDSRTIIGRRDAADLPVSPQGRCYMLHGDNQLDLFQAATVQTTF